MPVTGPVLAIDPPGPHTATGGAADHFFCDGSFETSRSDAVSPSSWKCGLR
jgi:hypothetical protein